MPLVTMTDAPALNMTAVIDTYDSLLGHAAYASEELLMFAVKNALPEDMIFCGTLYTRHLKELFGNKDVLPYGVAFFCGLPPKERWNQAEGFIVTIECITLRNGKCRFSGNADNIHAIGTPKELFGLWQRMGTTALVQHYKRLN